MTMEYQRLEWGPTPAVSPPARLTRLPHPGLYPDHRPRTENLS